MDDNQFRHILKKDQDFYNLFLRTIASDTGVLLSADHAERQRLYGRILSEYATNNERLRSLHGHAGRAPQISTVPDASVGPDRAPSSLTAAPAVQEDNDSLPVSQPPHVPYHQNNALGLLVSASSVPAVKSSRIEYDNAYNAVVHPLPSRIVPFGQSLPPTPSDWVQTEELGAAEADNGTHEIPSDEPLSGFADIINLPEDSLAIPSSDIGDKQGEAYTAAQDHRHEDADHHDIEAPLALPRAPLVKESFAAAVAGSTRAPPKDKGTVSSTKERRHATKLRLVYKELDDVLVVVIDDKGREQMRDRLRKWSSRTAGAASHHARKEACAYRHPFYALSRNAILSQFWRDIDLQMPNEIMDDAGAPSSYPAPSALKLRSVIYSGAKQNVPYPWTSVDLLSGFDVTCLDLRCDVTVDDCVKLAEVQATSRDVLLSLKVAHLAAGQADTPGIPTDTDTYNRIKALTISSMAPDVVLEDIFGKVCPQTGLWRLLCNVAGLQIGANLWQWFVNSRVNLSSLMAVDIQYTVTQSIGVQKLAESFSHITPVTRVIGPDMMILHGSASI
ncbi:hypothetical protein BD626DRAFT_570250 [Schizophyllum amplum]|uniref:Uncharacterized protein n=1 Tax=Schizophyllum amplum TaxID=97359 RepID=A0A550CB50_9AGAR|nr:hypothetical protein BD626DRAFT_570250 [Auriculariopsis ampla]